MLVAEYSYEEDIRVKQEEARIEGIERGEDRISELIRILIAEGQYDKLAKISENRAYRSGLLKHYGI